MIRQRQAGFALLIVLWALVLLSFIVTQMLSAGRSEAQRAGNLRQAALAEAVADGAVQDALFHLAAGGAQAWAPRGAHVLRIGRGVAEVAIDDLSGKVNPNTAGLQLLSALFGQCGAPGPLGVQLARAVMAWRGAPPEGGDPDAAYRAAGLPYAPPGMPMQAPDEMGLVAGVTPGLMACLAPHLSLLQDGQPGLHGTDALVNRAVAAAVQAGDTPEEPEAASGAVRITAVATVDGGRFVRRADARIGGVTGGRPFRILNWGMGP